MLSLFYTVIKNDNKTETLWFFHLCSINGFHCFCLKNLEFFYLASPYTALNYIENIENLLWTATRTYKYRTLTPHAVEFIPEIFHTFKFNLVG